MPLSGGGAAAGGYEYVDRGDPNAADFETADFTFDNAYHDLDLSAIVTDSDAEVVFYRAVIKATAAGHNLICRKNGNANEFNTETLSCPVANVYIYAGGHVACDENQVIEYKCTAALDYALFIVRGWLKPAS
jgi:hypothetical protein